MVVRVTDDTDPNHPQRVSWGTYEIREHLRSEVKRERERETRLRDTDACIDADTVDLNRDTLSSLLLKLAIEAFASAWHRFFRPTHHPP